VKSGPHNSLTHSRASLSLWKIAATERIKLRIFVPLIAAVATLIIVFLAAFLKYQKMQSEREITRSGKEIQQLLRAEQEQKESVMRMQLQAIVNSEKIAEALEARNRDELVRLGKPLYEGLVQFQRITHFYFHGLNRTNILRLHHPDEFGDQIKRFTAIEAQRTGQITSGIERGPLGTFVLRVVAPCYRNGSLIGYVELGTEFEEIVKRIRGLLSIDFVVAVDKQFLDREKWIKALHHSHRQGSWDEFQNVVVMDKTLPVLPKIITEYLASAQNSDRITNRIAMDGTRATELMFLPLQDVQGKCLGQLIALRDISESAAEARKAVRTILMVGILVAGGLLTLFYFFLSRIQNTLADQSSSLRMEIAERERAQAALQSAHEKLELRVEERTRELKNINSELQREIAERERAQRDLAETHKKLLETSRLAGMSEVATGVLQRAQQREHFRDARGRWTQAITGTRFATRCHLVETAREQFGKFLCCRRPCETSAPVPRPVVHPVGRRNGKKSGRAGIASTKH
jgi:two-component system, NtrC family, sensor kinase